MLLPCPCIGRIGTQRLDGDEQVPGLVLPDGEMPFVRAQFRTGRAVRRVGTAIMHGQMDTSADPIRKRGHIQLAHFVLDPSSISITTWLSYLDLAHHFRSRGLLFLQTVGVIFGLETREIDLDILFRHGKALVPKKLFHGVNIDPLLDHVGCNGVPELVCRYQVRVPFLCEMGSQLSQGKLDLPAREDSRLCPKQVMGVKVVWSMLDTLPAFDEWHQ